MIILRKTHIFLQFSQPIMKVHVIHHLNMNFQVIWRSISRFLNFLKFFSKKSKIRKTKFFRASVDPLRLFRSISNLKQGIKWISRKSHQIWWRYWTVDPPSRLGLKGLYIVCSLVDSIRHSILRNTISKYIVMVKKGST